MNISEILAILILTLFLSRLVWLYCKPNRSKKLEEISKKYKLSYVKKTVNPMQIFSTNDRRIYNHISGKYNDRSIDICDVVSKFYSGGTLSKIVAKIYRWDRPRYTRRTCIDNKYYQPLSAEEIEDYILTGKIENDSLDIKPLT